MILNLKRIEGPAVEPVDVELGDPQRLMHDHPEAAQMLARFPHATRPG
jgi:hypothetical protein